MFSEAEGHHEAAESMLELFVKHTWLSASIRMSGQVHSNTFLMCVSCLP